MKTRWTILLLTMALLAGACGALAQGEQPLNQDIGAPEDTWFTSAAFYQGSLLLGGRSIYQLVLETEELKAIPFPGDKEGEQENAVINELVIAAGEDVLYGLDTYSQQLYQLTVDEQGLGLGQPLSLDLSPLRDSGMGMGADDSEEYGYIQPPAQMLLVGDRLYMVGVLFGPKGPESKLFSYDLKQGGAPTMHQAEFVQQLARYKDGQLLALVMDPEKAFDFSAQQMASPSLALWDPQADTLTTLVEDLKVPWRFEGGSLAYDPEGDYIYLAMGTDVYRREAKGEMQVCAYLNPSNRGGEFSGKLHLLPDGRLAYASSEGVSLRSTDPAQLPAERLVIYGDFVDDVHKRAMQQMAGTAVTFLDDKFFGSAQQLGQALVGGEDAIDIFFLRSEAMDLNNLMAKGYAVDLSASPVIQAYMQGLYPMMMEAGTRDGKVLLVPVNMSAEMQGYYPKVMQQVGVEPPATFDELLDLLQRWNDELGEQHPDHLPMHSDNYNLQMTGLALQLYAAEMAATGQPFSFSDPMLKDMLQRVAQLRTEDIAEKVDWSQPGADMGDIYNKVPMIEPWYHLVFYRLNELFSEEQAEHYVAYGSGQSHEVGIARPLQLSIQQGKPPRLPVTLTMMGVNPRSKHVETAIQYVEAYLQNIEVTTKIMMNPSLNDPVENPDADRYNQWMLEMEEDLKQQIQKAEGAEKTELEDILQRAIEDHERQRESSRWLVRKEAIAFFREQMENAFVHSWGDLHMLVSNPDMSKLLQRYIEGQLPLEQFLQDAEGKLRLMRLEDQ